MSSCKVQVQDYSLAAAASMLGIDVDTLLTAAEIDGLELVYVIHRDTHARYVPLDSAPEVAIRGFAVEYFGEDGEKQYEHIADARLLIEADAGLIHEIRSEGRGCRRMGFVYGRAGRSMVWFDRLAEVKLDSLRVPAEEVERFRHVGDGSVESDAQAVEEYRFECQRARDTWTEVLRDLSVVLHRELGCNANSAQAWARMLENPPSGYFIEKQGRRITMPGELPMERAEFKRRWKKHIGKD